VVFDGVAPAAPPDPGALSSTSTRTARQPVRRPRQRARPGDRRRAARPPLARQLDLSDVNIAAARRLALAPGDVAVAGSFGVPLLIARERPGLRIAATSFDPRRSDLPMRPRFRC
jgi:hypothetical protein